jgi:outer membrane protein OmpA-like peptidoglycan-associated protein
MIQKRLFLFLFILGMAPLVAFGQMPYKRIILEPALGVSQGYLDVRSKASYLAGLNIRYSMSNIITFNVNGFAGGLRSSEKDPYSRTFKTDYYQFGIRGHVNFASLFDVFHLTHRVQPYFTVGIAAMRFNAKNVARKDVIAETAVPQVKRWALNYPLGFGLKLYLTQRLDLNLCTELIYSRTDSIDAHVANTFSDPNKSVVRRDLWYNNRIKSDMYFMFTVGLSIKFGKRIHRETEHVEWMPRELRVDRMIDSLYAEDLKLAERIDSILPDLDSIYQALNILNNNDIYINSRLDNLEPRVANLEAQINEFKAAWPIDFIYFDLDKYIIKQRYYENLYNLSRLLKAFPTVKVEIIGHTDPRHTDAYNVTLAKNRANAVYQAMRYYFNTPADRMLIRHEGEEEAPSNVNDENSFYLARRVEFKLIF